MFSEEYIKNKIETSDIWTIKSLKTILANGDLSEFPHDHLIFGAMLDYYDKYGSLSEKHMVVLRKLITTDQFLPILTNIANKA